MPAYSTSSVNMSGSSGTIVINVSEKAGGGNLTEKNVTVTAAIQDSAYTFTGGSPTATATFGNSGARWSNYTFTGSGTINYNFSSSASPGSTFFVSVLDNDTDEFNVEWGTIPSEGTLSPMMLARPDEFEYRVDPSFWRKIFKKS